MEQLAVPIYIYRGILEHAYQAQPREAIGLLGGDAEGTIKKWIPLPNLAGLGSYLADPRAQYGAFRQFKSEGIEPIAVYHSHPGGGIRLSAEDLKFARQLPFIQVVIALARPYNLRVEVAAYQLTESDLREVPVKLIEVVLSR